MEDVNLNFEDLLDDGNRTSTENKVVETPFDQNIVEEPTEKEPDGSNDPDPGEEGRSDEIPDYSENSLYAFLQSKGIKDPAKVQFQNEDGSTEEIDFNSLTPQEQLEILSEVTDPGLSKEEIDTINYLRRNRVTLSQAIDYFSKKKLDDYLNEHPEAVHQKQYSIDDYSDDDLYLVDLKRKYPDFSDEELLKKLDSAKADEELYKKETEIIRNSYKAQEDQAEADRVQQEQQQVQDLRNNLMAAASNFNEVQLDYTDDKSDSLVIEDADKQQMISYILDQDADGKSQLIRDLENPDTLIELAWLRTQGADVLSSVTKYWKGLLADERAENKKLRGQIEKINKRGNGTVVVPKSPTQKEESTTYSAWDDSGLL